MREGTFAGRFAGLRDKLRTRWPEVADDVSPSLRARTDAFLEGPLPTSAASATCLTHDDLCDGHVLVDVAARRASGVIDWGDACIGDPALDLAGLWQWQGESFFRRMLDAYRGSAIDDGAVERARASATAVAISTLWCGVRGKRPEFVASGIRSLEHTLPA